MSQVESDDERKRGDGEGAKGLSSFGWAGVALQSAFSPGGTKSSSWSFLDRMMGDEEELAAAPDAAAVVADPASSICEVGVSVLEDSSFAPNPPSVTSSGNGNALIVSAIKDSTEHNNDDNDNNNNDNNNNDNNNEGLDNQGSELESSPKSPSGAKKKNKIRKKKVKTNEKKCKLKWGGVTEILFSRAVAYDRVPNHGGYPIALGL